MNRVKTKYNQTMVTNHLLLSDTRINEKFLSIGLNRHNKRGNILCSIAE